MYKVRIATRTVKTYLHTTDCAYKKHYDQASKTLAASTAVAAKELASRSAELASEGDPAVGLILLSVAVGEAAGCCAGLLLEVGAVASVSKIGNGISSKHWFPEDPATVLVQSKGPVREK